jgi:hypothetical protein
MYHEAVKREQTNKQINMNQSSCGLNKRPGEYSFHNIDLAKQEHKALEFRRMQPFGKVR